MFQSCLLQASIVLLRKVEMWIKKTYLLTNMMFPLLLE
jgi:hypothetical protein